VTPRLVFRPEAEAELLDARAWYESERVGLGAIFAAAVETTVTAILQNPLAYPRVKGDTRRALVRRFPYAVYFRLSTTRSSCWRSCKATGIRAIGGRGAESNFRLERTGFAGRSPGRSAL
jgi:plasmid stabilization system protein ParE